MFQESREMSDDHIKISKNDRMTDLIRLQKSNGSFEITNKGWTGSVLEEYLGHYKEVEMTCPGGFAMYLWITALSMKTLEVKMGDKKELWVLVHQKSKIFLEKELKNEKEKYEALIEHAEKYIKSK